MTKDLEPLSIRIATDDDAATLAAWNCEMAQETEGKPLELAVVRRGVQRALQDSSRGFYLLAERGDETVGQLMVTFEWSDWRDGNFWWVQSVYIRPPERRTGVYRALYDEVLSRAKADGDVCGVRLYVERDNRRAQQTYEALGMSACAYQMYEMLLPSA